MKKKASPQTEHKELSGKRESYEAPAIIYEGQITTRAGSPDSNPDNDPASSVFDASSG